MLNLFKQELKRKKSSVVLILLISGIVVLSTGFLISNCGKKGPLTKALSASGTHAIDFGDVPGPWPATASVVIGADGLNHTCIKNHTSTSSTRPGLGSASSTYWIQQGSGGIVWITSGTYYHTGDVASVSLSKSIASLEGLTEFTIQGWIKSATSTPASATSTPGSVLQGGIFSRADDYYGCVLFVDDDANAKFAVKPRATFSSAYIVDSGVSMNSSSATSTYGGWINVAGVFANSDHSATHAACTATVGNNSSIATDTSDGVHISYYDNSYGDLKYATCTGTCTTPGNWTHTRLSTRGGSPSSIAIATSTDAVHISYFDNTGQASQDLRYMTCANGANCTTTSSPPPGWSDTLVDGWGRSGNANAIAVDSSGVLHVAFFLMERRNCAGAMQETNDLKYATCDPGSDDCSVQANWTRITVDSTNARGNNPSIAIDSSKNLHISYFEDTNDRLMYATCTGTCTTAGNWTKTIVETVGGNQGGINSSIAVDSSDNLHISYWSGYTAADLKYATCTGTCTNAGNWTKIIVRDTDVVGSASSLAIDSSNNLHIVHFNDSGDDLLYATCTGTCTTVGNWTTTTVIDSGGDVGRAPEITVDSSDNLHVSYYDNTNGTLKYATCTGTCATAGNWTTTTLTDGDARGETPHIDIHVDGVFQACAPAISIGSALETTPTCGGAGTEAISAESNEQIGRSQITWSDVVIGPGIRLEGVIDDVRFYGVAKSQASLLACMTTEHGVSGACSIGSDLIGYWRSNEGTGLTLIDSSFGGNSGSKKYCRYNDFDGDGNLTDIAYESGSTTIVDCENSDTNCNSASAACSTLEWYGGWTAGYPFP